MNLSQIHGCALEVHGIRIVQITDAPGTVTVTYTMLPDDSRFIEQQRKRFEQEIEFQRPRGTIYTLVWAAPVGEPPPPRKP